MAVSRAMSQLTLLRCRRRLMYGDWVEWGPSPFLDGLEGLVSVVGGSGSARPSRQFPTGSGARRNSPVRQRPSFLSGSVSGGRPAAAPQRDGPRLGLGDVAVGVVVSHSSFGSGEVLAVDSTAGSVTVVFGGVRRILSLALAPLSLG